MNVDHLDLIYGLWIVGDREIAFNRSYHALWSREGNKITQLDRVNAQALGLESYEQVWFWNDGCSPLGDKRHWQRAEKILLRFLTGRPVASFLLDSPPRR